MNNQRQLVNLIKSISGQANVLTIPRLYITLTQSHRAALLLSQCVYWSDRSKDPDGWFYKTAINWKEELGIPRGGIETAMKSIEKWVETKIARVGPTPKKHYRVNMDLLVSSISDLLESDKSDLRDSDESDLSENSKSSYTEITTETTTKTKMGAVFDAYFKAGFGQVTGMTKDYIEDAVNEYTAEWVIEAMQVASKAGARRWAYVESVLKRWKSEGYQSPRNAEPQSSVAVEEYS